MYWIFWQDIKIRRQDKNAKRSFQIEFGTKKSRHQILL